MVEEDRILAQEVLEKGGKEREELDRRQERKEDEGTQEIAEVREARQAPERAQRPEGMQEQGGHDLRHRAPEMGVAAQMRIGRAAEVGDEPSRIHDEQGHGRHRGDAPPEPAPLREGEPDPQADDGDRRVFPGAESEHDSEREEPRAVALGEVDRGKEERNGQRGGVEVAHVDAV